MTNDPEYNVAMFSRRAPQDYRCTRCARLLGRFVMTPGLVVEIKCSRCGHINGRRVEINSTTAPLLVEMFRRMNGNTPRKIVEAAAEMVVRVEET